MPTVTLKDIAKACGVSFSTVSKALKGSSEIGQSTINLVRETAEKMGYQPNMSARALRTNRSYDIGVIFEDSTGSGLQHQYFAEIFDSINVTANIAGYNITFLNPDTKQINSYLSQAKYRGFDGVVIVSVKDFTRPDVVELLSGNLPVSVLDYNEDHNKSSVMSDNYQGMKTLVEHIIQKGHKRIAYIHGDNTKVTELRIKAFKDILSKYGIEFDTTLLKEGQYHNPNICQLYTNELLSMANPPTCIIYPDDFCCLGGLPVIKEKGYIVGKNLSIAGYDGILITSLLSPSITTYSQNARLLGENLIKSLINQIENPEGYVKETVCVSGKLFDGESVISIS